MKLLTTLLILVFASQVQAEDKNILDYKDWSANEVESHRVSEKGACVASTGAKEKGDTVIEVYSEAGKIDGFVKPVVQIVTTEVDPAMGVMVSIDGRKHPMTIVLKETKEVEVEVLEEGSSIPTIEKVEQQIFIGKFQEKDRVISLLRAKNNVKATFYSAQGEVGERNFSLRGSSRTIKTMMETCL